jgi:hypothetical protein
MSDTAEKHFSSLEVKELTMNIQFYPYDVKFLLQTVYESQHICVNVFIYGVNIMVYIIFMLSLS